MKNSFYLLFYLIGFIPVIVTFMVMPWIVRRNVFFGVSVPPSAFRDPDLRALRKKYLLWGLLLSAIVSVFYFVLVLSRGENEIVWGLNGALFALIFAIFFLYVMMWKRAKALKTEKKWDEASTQTVVADTSFYRGKIAVSPLWLLLYPLIIGVTIAVGFALYDQIPSTVPMQFDMEGNVSRTVVKSMALLFFGPATQAFIALLMGLVYWMMRRTRPEIDPKNAEKTIRQNTVFRYRWSAFIVFSGMLLMLIFLIMQVSFTGLFPLWVTTWIPMGATFLMVIGAIVLSITTGQSGSRVRVKATVNGESKQFNRNDDKYWKLGSLYYNPDDPALFVEKRFGVGFTNNWGRPMSWVIVIGFIVLLLVFVKLSGKLAG